MQTRLLHPTSERFYCLCRRSDEVAVQQTKSKKIANQLARAQNRALVKGQIRHHLGRFASNMAAKRRGESELADEAATIKYRASSAVENKKPPTKKFDDIVAITEESMAPSIPPRASTIEPGIKRKTLPLGASIQKQRVDSRGMARERLGGRAIVS